MRVDHNTLCGVSDHRGGEYWVPWRSRMGDGRFSPFTLELCPAKLNPLGLLLLSGPSSPLLSTQLSNGVGGVGVAVVNTEAKPSHRHRQISGSGLTALSLFLIAVLSLLHQSQM